MSGDNAVSKEADCGFNDFVLIRKRQNSFLCTCIIRLALRSTQHILEVTFPRRETAGA